MFKPFIACLFVCFAASATAQRLPAEFVHDRIHVIAGAPDGSTLKLLTDTGGGWNALGKSAVDRLKLSATGTVQVDAGEVPTVAFPEFLTRAGIPIPSNEPWLQGRLAVAPDGTLLDADGQLGTRWFAQRIWQIDYPAETLTVLSKWRPSVGDTTIALGFRTKTDGASALHFPRITVMVDRVQIDVLLDTGATAELTETSAQEFRLKPGTLIGTIYIIKSIFDDWQTVHPNWKVIEKADKVTGKTLPMIEVSSPTPN